MIEYIVIDDESNPRELLIYTIRSLGLPFRLVGEGKSLLEGIDLIKSLRPKVVFLDIQMPVHNGLNIRNFLSEEDFNFKLIFVTAYDQYTIQAIRLSAFDYLLKPIELNELTDCLNRVLKEKNSNEKAYQQLASIEQKNVLVIKSHGGTHFLKVEAIVFIAADGMYSHFQLVDKELLSSKPLKAYEGLHEKLFRCHRSYIINIDYVLKIEGQNVILKGGVEVPISRQNKSRLIEVLKVNS
ncbi:MAG: response regulator [Flavobacteriales bacterium]|jgi:two-component system LytT family response regulator|nr:response regulator [Flavobacteriales bacterium]